MTEQDMHSEEYIDLRQLFSTIYKWKAVIVLITLVSVITGGILSYFVLKPVYESKVMLMVTMASDKERVVTGKDDLESLISSVSRIPQMTMNTYVNQLKSEILLQKVSEKLAQDPSVYGPAALSGVISASVVKDSNLIDLRVSHNNPVMAARIANTVSSQFLELISEKNQAKMTRSVTFLDTQRNNVDKELDQVLNQLRLFESQPGGVAFLEQQFTSKNQDLAKYQSDLNQVRVDLSQSEAGLKRVRDELQNTPKTVPVQRVTAGGGVVVTQDPNPVYQDLSREYVEKETRVSELWAKMGAMEGIIAEIRRDVNQIQKALVERKADRERLEAEKKRLEEARNLLARKVTETQIAGSIDLGETSIVVVSPAMVPSGPVKPNKSLNMAIAFVLGLMVSVLVVFLMEYMDNTVKSPGDIPGKLKVPLLGAIPLSGREGRWPFRNGKKEENPELYVFNDSKSISAEAFRTLRTNIGFASVDRPCRVMLITSATPEDGKSVVAANLGVVMARAGRKVLIVDADLRRPVQHTIFGVDNREGLANIIAGGDDLSGALRNGFEEGLHLITSGLIPPNPSELLASDRMAAFLSEVRDRYDVVIVDSPPVMAVTDPAILAAQADGVVLVVKAGARVDAIAGAIDQLKAAGKNFLGVVLNRVKASSGGYYGYYYYYGGNKASV